MEETDFFSFSEEDKTECYRLDNLYIQSKSHLLKNKGVKTGIAKEFFRSSKNPKLRVSSYFHSSFLYPLRGALTLRCGANFLTLRLLFNP